MFIESQYCKENAFNILLFFVSPVTSKSMNHPPEYFIFGKKHVCVQTNESALIYFHEMLGNRLPDKIFLVASNMVKEEGDTPYGRIPHLEYLKRRIQEIFESSNICNRIEVQDYQDTLEDMDKAVTDLSEIAGKLSDFFHEHAGKEIYLHADMTGGFRHASMMMLSIMQLTKFLGIRIGHVLYSEQKGQAVYVANKIHAMFDLISGVNEYVQFGSIHTLIRYFERDTEPKSEESYRGKNYETGKTEKNGELQNLLETMQSFSDAIRLCRTDSIRTIMSKLKHRIDAFEDSGGNSSEEKIFMQLLHRVKAEYELVTHEDASELDVIRWCMKKGLWQQAMTFSTEQLPIYIVNHHICEPMQGNNYKKKGDKVHRYWQQGFIVTEQVALPKDEKKTEKAKENLYQFFLDTLQDRKEDINKDLNILELSPQKFETLVNEIETADVLMNQVRKHVQGFWQNPLSQRLLNQVYPHQFMREHRMFSRLLKFLYFSLANDDQSYMNFLYKNVSRESILRGLLNCSKERCVVKDEIYLLLCTLQSQHTKLHPKAEKQDRSAEDKWKEREKYWREAFSCGAVSTRYPRKKEEIIQLLRQFDQLRNERNRINHANDVHDDQRMDLSMDVKIVKGLIESCLESIRRIEKG